MFGKGAYFKLLQGKFWAPRHVQEFHIFNLTWIYFSRRGMTGCYATHPEFFGDHIRRLKVRRHPLLPRHRGCRHSPHLLRCRSCDVLHWGGIWGANLSPVSIFVPWRSSTAVPGYMSAGVPQRSSTLLLWRCSRYPVLGYTRWLIALVYPSARATRRRACRYS